MSITEQFIDRVLHDARDALKISKEVSGYFISSTYAYGGSARAKMYDALATLEKRGLLASRDVNHGRHQGKLYSLPTFKPVNRSAPAVKAPPPYRDVFAVAKKPSILTPMSAAEREALVMMTR